MILIVLSHGGMLLASNQITPGSLMSFLVATQTIQRSLGQLSVLFGQVVKGMTAGSRVFEVNRCIFILKNNFKNKYSFIFKIINPVY